jgi:release factor glutamine methyltransferase
MNFSAVSIIRANVLKPEGIINFAGLIIMRIASNKIKDIIRFFKEELKGFYSDGELETMIRYCFEEFSNIRLSSSSLSNENTVSESELLKYNFAVKDLKNHKPLQYILGKADFYGLKFIVNENVLIPRPETEELVQHIIQDLKNKNIDHAEILDIGTGSGCIPVSLMKHISNANVHAMDISERALEVARQNSELNNVNVNLLKDDILSPVGQYQSGSYDVIVSNPPYIRLSEKDQMEKNVLSFEPHLALFVDDDDALLFYRKIAEFAVKYLRKEGSIYFEINADLGPETKALIEKMGFKNVVLIKDMSNKNRILRGTLSKE